MAVAVKVTHTVSLPDAVRLARYQRAPELGPKLLFFSGGSALRKLSRSLKHSSHNSIHLITPFDSGGSSAHLRTAFSMLAVGDLRNRMMALAEEKVSGNPAIYRLFSHRLASDGETRKLAMQLQQLVDGNDPLMHGIPEPLRHLICSYLRKFSLEKPVGFDLRGASIGNLVMAGGFLHHERHIEAVLFLFSQLVEVRGTVIPIVDSHCHLAADLEDGSTVLGQHRLTGNEHAPLTSPIKALRLVDSLDSGLPTEVSIPDKIREMIVHADVICFPMGSFYSSVLANLLPKGVGGAVRDAICPKVYIPNTGVDPEQKGMSLSDTVKVLLASLRKDAGESVPTSDLLQFVLIDRTVGEYAMALDIEEVEALGVEVLDLPIADPTRPDRMHPKTLSDILLSLA